jgi:DNA-binding PadR family transcriptional regulator
MAQQPKDIRFDYYASLGTTRCMEVSQLLTHLRRGTMEFCVLAVLRGGEQYAGDLIHDLGAGGVLVRSQGTVFPSRLRRDGMVESTWRESKAGPDAPTHR